MKMGSISSMGNISKHYFCSNYLTDINLSSQQQWGFCTRVYSPFRFANTRNTRGSSSLYMPSLSRSFATLNSKSKVGFIEWYLGKLNSRPIPTKTITTSLIFAAADLTAQMLSSASSGSFDLTRTTRMAAYGLLVLGPSQHVWFNIISKAFPKRDVLTTLKKTFMGQAIYGPANACAFYSYNAALQGESGDEIVARLKRDVLPTLKNGLMYWPICDFFTYKFVPVHLQKSSSTQVTQFETS